MTDTVKLSIDLSQTDDDTQVIISEGALTATWRGSDRDTANAMSQTLYDNLVSGVGDTIRGWREDQTKK
jgi:hypothetical protein